MALFEINFNVNIKFIFLKIVLHNNKIYYAYYYNFFMIIIKIINYNKFQGYPSSTGVGVSIHF